MIDRRRRCYTSIALRLCSYEKTKSRRHRNSTSISSHDKYSYPTVFANCQSIPKFLIQISKTAVTKRDRAVLLASFSASRTKSSCKGGRASAPHINRDPRATYIMHATLPAVLQVQKAYCSLSITVH